MNEKDEESLGFRIFKWIFKVCAFAPLPLMGLSILLGSEIGLGLSVIPWLILIALLTLVPIVADIHRGISNFLDKRKCKSSST